MLALLLCGLNRKTLLALSGSTAAQPAHPTKRLMPLLKRQVLDAGGVLMPQGDPSSGALYLMGTGRLGVTLRGQNQGQRLKSARVAARPLTTPGQESPYGNRRQTLSVRSLRQ